MIGAGVAGIGCARTLEQLGAVVTVVEAKPRVGGRCASTKINDEGAALIGAPALAQNVDGADTVEIERDVTETVRRNISAFQSRDWRPYFSNLKNGAILCDIDSRAVHFWSEDGEIYKLYPSSVPLSEDLTRRGRTSVVRKVEGPSWRPTPSMLKRNPEWPAFVPPGPDNPLGTHALYLSWTYYRIRWFSLSAMYTHPFESTLTPCTMLNCPGFVPDSPHESSNLPSGEYLWTLAFV